MTNKPTDQKKPETISAKDRSQVQAAIKVGESLIKLGNTKIEAALAMYRLIGRLPQEIVVQALIEGASLTPKGALTYWYNCRRKLKKEKS